MINRIGDSKIYSLLNDSISPMLWTTCKLQKMGRPYICRMKSQTFIVPFLTSRSSFHFEGERSFVKNIIKAITLSSPLFLAKPSN